MNYAICYKNNSFAAQKVVAVPRFLYIFNLIYLAVSKIILTHT